MESAHIGIVILGSQSFESSIISLSIKHTLHLDLIDLNRVRDLADLFKHSPPQGYIFKGLPTFDQAETIIKWSRQSKFDLYIFDLNTKTDTSNKKNILSGFSKSHCQIFTFNGNKNLIELSQDVFCQISRLCFQEPGLAEKYFYFREVSHKLHIPHIIISGACSYIYYGKRSLKDIDVVVPKKTDLEKLSRIVNIPVIKSSSFCANMSYLNLKEVDVNSEIEIFWQEGGKNKVVNIDFNALLRDARKISFLGVDCLVASPEDTIIFKFCLGRLGIDDFNDFKDDFEDVRGLIISQPINWPLVYEKAKKMGALARIKRGKKLLGI